MIERERASLGKPSPKAGLNMLIFLPNFKCEELLPRPTHQSNKGVPHSLVAGPAVDLDGGLEGGCVLVTIAKNTRCLTEGI